MPSSRAQTATTREARLHVLFLQGPASAYFEQVARALIARGHRASRINLHFGDRLFWRLPTADYRGRLEHWASYLSDYLDTNRVTHLMLLGDMRPYHRIAIAEARSRGAQVICTELGYLRPDWVLLEPHGMTTNSRMPRNPEAIRQYARAYQLPDFAVQCRTPFWTFAALDMAYNLGAMLGAPLYPGYRRHAILHPALEYFLWCRKLFSGPVEKARTCRAIKALQAGDFRYFLLPLQLSTDYQIRAHSPFPDMETAARAIIASFAGHAPPDTRLVVKLHPLDPGKTDWRRLVAKTAAAYGIGERALFVDGADLAALLAGAAGCVTVNSTVGVEALKQKCPLKVLGNAIYDVDGLTFRGPLETFWTEAAPPDALLTDDFLRLLAGAIHIRGGFYTQAGLDLAVPATVARLECGFPDLPSRDRQATLPTTSG